MYVDACLFFKSHYLSNINPNLGHFLTNNIFYFMEHIKRASKYLPIILYTYKGNNIVFTL